MARLTVGILTVMSLAALAMSTALPQGNNPQQQQGRQQQLQRQQQQLQGQQQQRRQQQTNNNRAQDSQQQRARQNQFQNRPQQPRPVPGSQRRVTNLRQGDNAATSSTRNGDISRYLIPLTEMSSELLQSLLEREEDVLILTNCIIELESCTDPISLSILRQVNKLGLRGRCDTCTTKQQEHVNDMIYRFILGFRDNYPKHFRQILPHVSRLIAA